MCGQLQQTIMKIVKFDEFGKLAGGVPMGHTVYVRLIALR